MLLRQHHTIFVNNALEYVKLTTATTIGAHSQVYEFINHLILTGPNMDHQWNCVNVIGFYRYRNTTFCSVMNKMAAADLIFTYPDIVL